MQTSHFPVPQVSAVNLIFLFPFIHNDPWISWVSFYYHLAVIPEMKVFVASISLCLTTLPLLRSSRLLGTFVWVQSSLPMSEWWWNSSFIHTFFFLPPFFQWVLGPAVHDLSLFGSIFPNFPFFVWAVLPMFLFVSSFTSLNIQTLDQEVYPLLSVVLL